MRRVSDGMAQNAALAISTALGLGVSREVIQSRLDQWKPAALRGEIRHLGDRLIYVDCYNANPASMADALIAFQAMAPVEQPRLYVIGGMEELGLEAEFYHRELGLSLTLAPEDFVFVIGTYAYAVRDGLIAAGNDPLQIRIVTELTVVAERLSSFQGTVFVKGSRRYQLEKCLQETPATQAIGAH